MLASRGSGGALDEPGSEFTPGDGDTYAADRRRRLQRGRLVGFAVFVPVWVLSVVPLARDAVDEREGAAVVAVYLVAGAFSLVIAAVIRGLYVVLTKRRFWSPWVFLMAAVVAIASYTVQSAGDEVVPFAAAAALGSRVP